MRPLRRAGALATLALTAVLLGACTTLTAPQEPPLQNPHPGEPAMGTPVPPASPAASAPEPLQPLLPRQPRPPRAPDPSTAVLAWVDRSYALGNAELIQEIGRLNDLPETQRTAGTDLQLAIALGQTRVPSDLQRAQALLQKLLAATTDEARALQPLARLVASRLAEQKRLEELLDKQNQLAREQQRRIDQLNERLEAMRAIERSLTPRPNGGAGGLAAPRHSPP